MLDGWLFLRMASKKTLMGNEAPLVMGRSFKYSFWRETYIIQFGLSLRPEGYMAIKKLDVWFEITFTVQFVANQLIAGLPKN